jgi:putative DNA-binding protein
MRSHLETSAPCLLDLQRALRASLVAHDDGGISAYVAGAGIGAGERLDIYRNTFASVLTTALRLSYPAVHRLVGADFFEGAARSFIERHPPKCACLDDYGVEFPDFLSAFTPASSLPYLPDVARLEWAVSRALHAADAEPLDARRLAALGDTERVRVTFVPHPSLAFVHVRHPADDIWRAVLQEDDAALAAINPAASRAWLLVQRLPEGVETRRMSESAWRFTAALCAGRPLPAALAEAGNIDAPALLAEHLASGRFADFSLIESIDP